MKYLSLSLLLVLFCPLKQAQAQDRNGQLSLGAGVGPAIEAPWASDAFRSKVGLGPRGTAFARYHHESNYSGFELALDYFKLSQRTFASRSLTLHYFWRFAPEAKIHPVLAVGFGYAQVKGMFVSGDFDNALWSLRTGVEYELNKDSDLAFHLDHLSLLRNEPTEPSAHLLVPTVKFIRYFGRPAPAMPPTAAAAAVDSDRDGIFDGQDKCPGTPAGSAVNEFGCARKQAFEIKLDVKFRSGTAELAGAEDAGLASLAHILAENSDLRVEIQGHTDSSGGSAKNQRLSQARADTVRELLVSKHHVAGNRLKAVGYGSQQAVDTNATAAGRANNRRVTASVIR